MENSNEERKSGKVFSIEQEFDNESVKKVYIEILTLLGVDNPEETLQHIVENDNIKDGNALNRYVESLFIDADTLKTLQQAKTQKEWDNLKGDKSDSIDEARKLAAKKILENLGDNVSTYAKAYLLEMSDQYIPFDTVLTSGIKVGEGQSLQMGCGEGKSGVVSMAAYNLLSQPGKDGKRNQVFITSSTEELAGDSFSDKIDFYVNSGLAKDMVYIQQDKIVYPVIDEEGKRVTPDNEIDLSSLSPEDRYAAVQKALSCGMVIATNMTLMQLAMDGQFEPASENDNVNRHILADEADFVTLDQYRPMQRTGNLLPEENKRRQELRFVAYDILQEVLAQGKNLYDIDDENQYVDFNDQGRKLVVQAINSRYGNNQEIDKNKLYDYVYDALTVETIYRENRDYQLLDLDNNGTAEELVSEDRASGSSIDFPEGIKQALQIKLKREGRYTGEISEEKEVLGLLDAKTFLTKYFSLTGKHFISGTLGLDSQEVVEELDTDFHITKDDIYDIPPREEAHREEQGKQLFRDSASKREAIADNAKTELKKGRPVLIGTVSEQEIKGLREIIDQQYADEENKPMIYEYTAASEKIFKEDKKRLSDEEFKAKYYVDKNQYKSYKTLLKKLMKDQGGKDVLIIGTSILGRGLTLKTDKATQKRGGIHVIIDGLHETSSRNQQQFKARTARGTDPGSVIEMFSLEDIPEQYRDGIDENTDPDVAYKTFYKRVDGRTASVRKYVKEFVQLTEQQLEEIENLPSLSEEDKNRIKALVTARAFQIRTRACGISDKFKGRVEQYKKEIAAYSKMYVARCMAERQGVKFDETEWLKNHGYENIADTYIPFSKEREEKTFTLFGIKNQAEQTTKTEVQNCSNETRENVVEQSQDLGPTPAPTLSPTPNPTIDHDIED